MAFWTHWLLAVLATWRVAELLVYEDGPGDLLARFRVKLGRSVAGRLMDCFQCTSMWVAAALAFFVTRDGWEWPLVWLSLAGGASVLERICPPRDRAARLEFEEPEDELLRTETRSAERSGEFAGRHRSPN